MIIDRKVLLGVAFASTLALVGWTAWREHYTPEQPSTTVAPSTHVIAASEKLQKKVHPFQTDKSKNADVRDPLIESKNDPFKVVSFLPPPPKVIATPPPPPPKPVAPAFPYRYFGRMTDINGNVFTYLVRGEELSIVKEKQILDNVFQIESMSETQLIVKYLPLNEQSVISIQSAER